MAKGLGRGLDAFFPAEKSVDESEVQEVKLTDSRPNPYQPRKTFSEKTIAELKQSIEKHGILQPLIVRKSIKGYEIVVGERRYRAAREAGMEKIPVVVRDLDEQKMMEMALIENLQREDLNPLEEALAYKKLMEKLGLKQEQLAHRLGKSRPHIANHLRLLQLPDFVQQLIADEQLTMGHGRTLLGLKDKKKLKAVVKKVLKENMNVRQLEKWITELNKNVSRETTKAATREKSVFIKEKEAHLREKFGTAVAINRTKKKGKIEIEFYSDEDLNRLLDLLEGVR